LTKGAKGKKRDNKDKRDKKYRDKRDENTGTNNGKRSLICQIVKIQVHLLWVKSDRSVESVLKSVLEIITRS
jgi:hypothetical protein